MCASAYHCCNENLDTGSNGKLSCLQACMVRVRGTSRQACEGLCYTNECFFRENGHTYPACFTCTDVPAHGGSNVYPNGKCSHVYGSDTGTCLHGCSYGAMPLPPESPPPPPACGTDQDADNCGGFDVYKAVRCMHEYKGTYTGEGEMAGRHYSVTT